MWNNQGSQTRYLIGGDLELISILQSKEKTFHISLLMRGEKTVTGNIYLSSTVLRDGGDLSALISTCLITRKCVLEPAGS